MPTEKSTSLLVAQAHWQPSTAPGANAAVPGTVQDQEATLHIPFALTGSWCQKWETGFSICPVHLNTSKPGGGTRRGCA